MEFSLLRRGRYRQRRGAASGLKLFAAGGQDGILRVWNGATGTSIATFEPPKAPTPEPQKTAAVTK